MITFNVESCAGNKTLGEAVDIGSQFLVAHSKAVFRHEAFFINKGYLRCRIDFVTNEVRYCFRIICQTE